MILENGLYRAVVRDISVYLRGENERLTGAFRLECEGKELVHREWLELNDGTISDKTIRRLRECFPKWDGSIETLEQGFCVQDVEVDITVENEVDRHDPEKWWTRVRYMDPPGGTSGTPALPESVKRETLVSRYGARFRALAGGVPAGVVGSRQGAVGSEGEPVGRGPLAGGSEGNAAQTGKAPAEPPAAAAPASPPPRKVPAGKAGETSTLEACWEALCKKHPDEMREQVSERWFEILEQTVPDKDQADYGPEDWGTVMAVIGVPF